MDRTDTRPMVSLLIPAYNEASILQTNLGVLCEHMETQESRYRWELIVVNDGSTDDTGAIAEAFARTRDNVRVLQHPMNFRLGQALRFGFGNCRGDYVVTFDIDLTYSPDHIGLMLDRIEKTGAKIVVASPYMAGGRTTNIPWLRLFLSRWGNRFLALTARGVSPTGDIATLTGMVRAYDRRFLRSLNLKSMGMEINTEIIYKALILSARVEEVPAHLDWSHHGKKGAPRTSSKRLRRGIVFSLLAGFIIRPFAFFIFPSIALGLVSLYVLVWIGIHVYTNYQELSASGEYFDFGFSAALSQAFVQSPHAFIVGGITLLLSVQLFSLGVLAVQVKQYFEELFHFGTSIYRHSQDLEDHLVKLKEMADD